MVPFFLQQNVNTATFGYNEVQPKKTALWYIILFLKLFHLKAIYARCNIVIITFQITVFHLFQFLVLKVNIYPSSFSFQYLKQSPIKRGILLHGKIIIYAFVPIFVFLLHHFFFNSKCLNSIKFSPCLGWFGLVIRALACRLKDVGSILVKGMSCLQVQSPSLVGA